jgi:uncharacterized protein YyaL (SSP411 family)
MLKAFAEAGALLEDENYIGVARHNAQFLLEELVRDGRVLRTWKDGRAKLNGYLEDYSFLVDALQSLYEATFEERWLHNAISLADGMIDLFWNEREGIFYDTGHDHERLLVRPRDIFDNAMPSGSSAAAYALLRLTAFTGKQDYADYAVKTIRSVRPYLERLPTGFAHWLAALDFYLSTPKEVAIIGERRDAATKSLLRTVQGRYLPNRVLAGAERRLAEPFSPLLAERDVVDGQPAAYVCENYVCQLPVTTPQALALQLEA